MSVMLYYAATRTTGVADLAQEEIVSPAQKDGNASNEPLKENELAIDRSARHTKYFCVPMPEAVKAEEVVLENHYMDRELWVSVSSDQAKTYEEFYRTTEIVKMWPKVFTRRKRREYVCVLL